MNEEDDDDFRFTPDALFQAWVIAMSGLSIAFGLAVTGLGVYIVRRWF